MNEPELTSKEAQELIKAIAGYIYDFYLEWEKLDNEEGSREITQEEMIKITKELEKNGEMKKYE